MTNAANDPLWYKDAIIYQLHVKAFCDSNQDGIGDFPGLTSKLDYVQALGVNTIWILPFYPSPQKDDGYDIADYRDVHPNYGTMDDFKNFVKAAHERGIRIITELVINHTSDQHPWFQAARLAPEGSPERNFYVWSDTDQKYQGTRIIFSDTEKSNWTWDAEAKRYYWHRFFSHQPDLNFDNPRVLEAVLEIMFYWLDMGVDGLRLDAVPYLCEREGTNNENLPETHEIIRKIRAALDSRYPDRLLLAEANQWPEDVQTYFGNGDECHMAFHFPLMPRIYMAVAQEDRHPVTDIMNQTPDIPENCQWATFLRNHDELTLEMVTDRERDYLWNFYASDRRARINFGIRRRLAPLMDNDRRKIELLDSLLMSMPGTPVLYYGDEIGMGDNIYLGDRNGVRTPMQWSPDRNGGFSMADPAQLYLPAIMDPIYGYQALNVEAQLRSQNSLLNWTRHLIEVTRERQSFSRGKLRFVSPSNRKILAYVREYAGETVLCVVNLSRSPQPAELDLSEFAGYSPFELLGESNFPAIGELPYFITLPAYGFYWFLLKKEVSPSQTAYLPELWTVVAPKGWESITANTQLLLERKMLPAFIARQRWYQGKHKGLPQMEIISIIPLGNYRLFVVAVISSQQEKHYYLMSLGIAWEQVGDDPLQRLQSSAIALIRQNNRVGVLYEAMNDEKMIQELFTNNNEHIISEIVPELDVASMKVTPLSVEQSNSSMMIDETAVMKIIRKLQPGINPDEEISRFFTETSLFDHTPKMLGTIKLELDDDVFTIGMMQQFVKNQGDGWKVTQDYLLRFLDDLKLTEIHQTESDYYNQLARQLGIRTAEMHIAFGKKTGNDDFDPETITEEDRAHWINAAIKQCEKLPSDLLREHKESIVRLLQEMLPTHFRTKKTRLHRDFHLGQVLVVENDFFIIDFEGEPILPMEERRLKSSPFKDVAGMLRSFDYAAGSALRSLKTPDEKAQAALEKWRDEAVASFLDGYQSTYFQDEKMLAEFQAIIDFFQVDKAIYEIMYEAQNRPGWLDIPVNGLKAIMVKRGIS